MTSITMNMDCMEFLKTVPDGFFDLAVVDPPYGIGQAGEKNASRSCLATSTDYAPFYGNDREPPPQEYFDELFRVSKYAVIFGANHFIDRVNRPASCWLVWDKENGENDFADAELAWTNLPGAVRLFRYRWQGMLQGNMKEKEQRIHPTQKPVALYAWIFNRWAKPGMKILDTHLGSGSSRIAAYDAGLDFVGCEIDPTYYRLQEERFEQHKAQTSLFVKE